MKRITIIAALALSGCMTGGIPGHTDIACYSGGQLIYSAKRVDIRAASGSGIVSIYREGEGETGSAIAVIHGGICVSTKSKD